jgi:hypothetical protein
MSRSVRSYITIHVCAICWALTLVFGLVGISFFIQANLTGLICFISTLYLTTKIAVPVIPSIRNFLVEGAKDAMGGCEIVNPIAQRSRECHSPNLYAIHPHGLTSTCAGVALSSRQGERVALAVAPFLQWCNPAMRVLMNLIGVDLISSSSEQLQSTMRFKKSIGIVVGGFDEMLRNREDLDLIYLQNRRGFIKYAITHGYSITPVYCFGESLLYSNMLPLPGWLRDFLANWKVPILVPRGRSWWNAMPRSLSRGAKIVFGDPIVLPKGTVPTREIIDKTHKMYMDAITDMYNKHNPYPDRPLVIM